MINYSEKIHYNIIISQRASFHEMVDNVLEQIPNHGAVLRLVFFYSPGSNAEYVEQKEILLRKVKYKFGNNTPVASYVAQPPLSGTLILEIHSYTPTGNGTTISYKETNGIRYVLLEAPGGRFLYAGGFQADVVNMTIAQQSQAVFHQIDHLLKDENFPIDSIVRQWNYIEQITDYEKENQNYQSFNNAREDFYHTATWHKGYPAATGIGANLGGILIDIDAVIFNTSDLQIKAIDNKLQVAAHNYSGKVLKDAQDKRATPKFERAKSLSSTQNEIIYISGTAAIRGEDSLEGVPLATQLKVTMENIAELTGSTKLVLLRVYIKEESFYQEAKQLLDGYKLNIPISYMLADVCRNELLIEIEGIAIK